jgi:dTDP-4-dehydrorhamnose reductase
MSAVKVLVTGAAGQLGSALLRAAPDGADVVAVDRRALDIRDVAAVADCLAAIRPAVVINAAAYTAVDKAESEEERAFDTNAWAVRALANACAECDARLIHVSTDFVFDGHSGRPYPPDASVCPLNAYGASKLAGELEIAATTGLRWLIVRTAWIYSASGHNFLRTMLRLFRERSEVSVVCDQVGTPTSATTLAHFLWRAAEDTGPSGILHFTDAGVASWYDFAVAIYEDARALGLLQNEVELIAIPTARYPTPARRPPYSVLDKWASLERLRIAPQHWRGALRSVLQEMVP